MKRGIIQHVGRNRKGRLEGKGGGGDEREGWDPERSNGKGGTTGSDLPGPQQIYMFSRSLG